MARVTLAAVLRADDGLVCALNSTVRRSPAAAAAVGRLAAWLAGVEVLLMLALALAGRRDSAVRMLVAVGLVYRDTLDHGVPTVRTATSLGTGLLHGWARMLSVGLPADVTADLLITPVLVTFVATVCSLVLTVVVLPWGAGHAPSAFPSGAARTGAATKAAQSRTQDNMDRTHRIF